MHSDDFVVATANQFNIVVLVPGPNASQSLRVLNRSTRWAQRGVVYKGDQKHADQLINESRLNRKRMIIRPVLRERRRARKKEGDVSKRNSIGEGATSQESAGENGAGRGGGRARERPQKEPRF